MSCKSLKTKALGTKKPQEQSWGVKVDQPGDLQIMSLLL